MREVLFSLRDENLGAREGVEFGIYECRLSVFVFLLFKDIFLNDISFRIRTSSVRRIFLYLMASAFSGTIFTTFCICPIESGTATVTCFLSILESSMT